MNYNQNYEYEEEIDLIKLILFVFSKWKSIIASVLVCAVLGGALAVLKPAAEQVISDVTGETAPNYSKEISIISSDEAVFDAFMDSFYTSGALHKVIEEKYTAEDEVENLVEMYYDSAKKAYNPNLFNVYGATETEVDALSKYLVEAIDEYIRVLYGKELKYAVVESAIVEIQVEEIIVAAANKTKNAIIYALVGAVLGGIASAGVWFVVFFVSGKLYAVADIERKFRTKLLGTVAVCDKKNPIDKWLFHKMNGIYSEFSKEEQEKIVLLNIKNEFKKNENIKNIMLVSSLGEAMNEAAAFIKTGLEEAGYTVSDCVNVIGRPDVLEDAKNYDVAIVVESMDKSKNKLVELEIKAVNEHINSNVNSMVTF